MLASIEKSRQDAKTDRLVQIEDIGKSAQGRDIKLGIISSDQKSINDYLSTTNPQALTKPAEMLAALKNGNLDYKLPVLINNTHADEQPGIDIITGLFKTFATKDQVSFKTSAADGSEKLVQRTLTAMSSTPGHWPMALTLTVILATKPILKPVPLLD